MPSAEPDAASGTTPSDGRPGRDLRYPRAFLRTAQVLLGPGADVPAAEDAVFDRDQVQQVVAAARKAKAQAQLVEALSRGRGIEEAVLQCMRHLIDAGEWSVARALVDGIASVNGADRAHRLGALLAAHRREWVSLAWAELGALDDVDAADYLPVEAIETCFLHGGEEALSRARAIATHADRISDESLVNLAGRFLAMGQVDEAQRLQNELAGRGNAVQLDERHAHALSALDRWLSPSGATTPPTDAAVIGVIDYDQPDQSRASRNVGDYIQTLAMLGNLARLTDTDFTGDAGLGDLVTRLQSRVRPELRIAGVAGRAHFVSLNRDFSTMDPVPPTTFAIAFGWHMHSLFGLRHDFPYHENLRPIFVSLHINRPEMLTPEALDYLRKYGPVGCRDWTTVDLLLSAGVDAFFTGCLTTTVDAVFPPTNTVEHVDDLVAVIDAPPGAAANIKRPTEVVSHGGQEVRLASLVEGVEAANTLLRRYQSHYRRIITGRLHSYLPATSLGLPVKFVPPQPADARFDGLWDLEPDSAELGSMREGIRHLVAEVMTLVVMGRDETEVYGRWRELTTPLVQAARQRFGQVGDGPLPVPRLLDSIEGIRNRARPFGPHHTVDPSAVTDVALSLDQNLKAQLPVTVEALTANATGPLRLWITCRGLDEAYVEWIAAAFPDVPITFLPCDGLSYGDNIFRLIEHTTITTIDRLLLPELLVDVDRVTYIDIDAVVLGDVCVLAQTDLGGTALAARTASRLAAQVWRRAGSLIPQDRAFDLWHRMSARHTFGHRALNAGILVLDLDRMRSDAFTQTFVPWVGWYGLNDQDVLLAYVGADRAELDPRWNAWPVMDVVEAPAIVHYLGSLKPWGRQLAPGQEVWKTWEQRSRRRVGMPPS